MQSNKPLKMIMLSYTIAFSAIFIFFLTIKPPVQSSYLKSGSLAGTTATIGSKQKITAVKQIGLGDPIRLSIPKIKVNAIIEQVGLTRDGAVDVPKGPVNAAWFNLGPRPGDEGSAVIVGHFGRWKNGIQTVFNNINKLRKGDKLSVKNGQGATISFVVREIKTYKASEDVPDVFYSSDGKSHLNLVTCVGVWNKISKRYSERLVVFADKE